MKAETNATEANERPPGDAPRIICGGGWKSPPNEYRLKIKALVGALLTVATASAGFHYYPDYGVFGMLPGAVLLIATALLFYFERPTPFLGPQDGDYDIRNLYVRSDNDRRTDKRVKPNDHKVA